MLSKKYNVFLVGNIGLPAFDEMDEYDKIGEKSDALILTMFNDKNNIMNMVHTINITKKNGGFYVHNNGFNQHKDTILFQKRSVEASFSLSLFPIIKTRK